MLVGLQSAAKEQTGSRRARDTACHYGRAFVEGVVIQMTGALSLSTLVCLERGLPPVYKLIGTRARKLLTHFTHL